MGWIVKQIASRLAISATFVASVLSGADAADLLTPPASLATPANGGAPANDWTGPSLGFDVTDLWGGAAVNVPGVGTLKSLSFNGPGAGLTLGYDYQFSPALIIGGAFDLNGSDAKFSVGVPNETVTARTYGSWALRGRIGAEVGDGAFAYATAGLSQLFGDASAQGAVNGSTSRQTFNGGVVGVGMEMQLDTNMYARVEYLHGIYSKQSYLGGAYSLAPETDSARLTLVLRPDSAHVGNVAARDWSGAYVGVLGGSENERLSASGGGASVAGIGGVGFSGAVVAGYNLQNDRSVIGVEGEMAVNSAKASLTDTSGDSVSIASSTEASVRARLGALVAPSTLLYAALGGAWTHADAKASIGGATASGSSDFAGLQYGLGAETLLTSHIGVRLEYIETRYAKKNYLTLSTGRTQAGLVYKF